MPDDEAILKLIDRIYAAAMDSDLWPEALQGISSIVDCICSDMYIEVGGQLVYASIGGLPEDAQTEFVRDYLGIAQRSIILPKSPTGTIISDLDFTSEREMSKDPFYEDFLRKWGLRHWLGLTSLNDGTEVAYFGIHRPIQIGPPDSAHYRILRPVVRHLTRASQMSIRFAHAKTRERRLVDCIDALAVGVVLLDARGEVSHMNQAAETIAASNDGLAFVGKRLSALYPNEDRQLARLIGGALASDRSIQASGGAMLVTRSTGARAYSVVVAPLSAARRGWEGLGAVVFIANPDRTSPMSLQDMLRALYRLTPAEARLAASLADGANLRACAEANGITYESARITLKRVMQKTDTRRQAELVRLISVGLVVPASRTSTASKP